jgi:hypothetical protein
MRKRKLFRVKFHERHEKQPTTLVCERFSSSEFGGFVTLDGLIFYDQTRFIVLPEEDETHKRFAHTERLHLPFHVLLSVEEFVEDEADVRHLPFIREVAIENSVTGASGPAKGDDA